jgi:hypothetical protein
MFLVDGNRPPTAASGMIVQRRVVRTTLGYDSQVVLGDRRGGDSPLTRAPAGCQCIECSDREDI